MSFLGNLKQFIIHQGLSEEEQKRVDQIFSNLNSAGYDRWGVSPEDIKTSLASSLWFYRNYFRVEVCGIEKVPAGKVILAGNHSGQIPIDGALLATAMVMDAQPPRLIRGMVERWAPSLPFISTFFARMGQVTGDSHNCRDLLENGEAVMVFPEGTAGSGKTIFERYQLQKFGTGFARLSIETQSPIQPIAIIGCEEALPSLSRLMPFAKMLGMPYLPLVFTGMIPLPTKVTLRFCDPIQPGIAADSTDAEVQKIVDQVRESIAQELKTGLEIRGEKIFTGAGCGP